MLHFGSFDIRTDIFILITAVCLVFIQFFICLKIKNKCVRRIPVIVSSTVCAVLAVLCLIAEDLDALGFFFLAGCVSVEILACGIGWALWRIIKKATVSR